MPAESLSVLQSSVPGEKTHRGAHFPLVLQCGTTGATLAETCDWLRSQRDRLLEQANRHGAILYRGFPIATPIDFDAFIQAFDLPNFPYQQSLSNAVRVNRTERVFTANEAPPDVTIFLHHEMAQTPIFPSQIFFFCERPADAGGATPICRSDVLLERLAERCPEFVEQCARKGLKYSNVMPSQDDPQSGMGRSWQSTLRAETREAAEARLAALGYSCEWLSDGCLRATTPILPAIRHVDGGRKTFFNQLIAAYRGWKDNRNDPSRAIRLGDDSVLDPDAVATASALADELTFDIAWQAGDVALLDNFVAMHGRRTFQGTRRVLASLAAVASHDPVGV